MNKKELRKEILVLRDALTAEEKHKKSAKICKQIIEQKEFQNADKILLFASFRSEVDVKALFEEARSLQKSCYYPKVHGDEMEFYQVQTLDELVEGKWGIFEPEANPNKRFLCGGGERIFLLMPGVVFDEEGNRIGYGGGYYDRYLEQLERKIPKENICKTAAAFQCQIVQLGQIQMEVHDVKPDYIVTEEHLFLI